MEVRLFGELEVVQAGERRSVRGAKQRALLALLALNRGRPVSSDRLIDQLWGDGQTGKPANALQAQIVQLRRTLGASAIVTSDAGYSLDVSAGDVDTARFEDLVAEGRRLNAEGDLAMASIVLADALVLRRGEPLSEFAYASFADADRARLNELVLVATESRVEADLALGRHNELVGELEGLCRENTLRERLWELLMLALYRSGRQAEALRAYTQIRDRLVSELGIDPGSALRKLETRIIGQDPSLAAEQPAPLRPPVPAQVAGNLPESLSSFVGRAMELEQLGEAILSSRLVTLVGPGGVGKTRLALEAAARLRTEYSSGAWLIELAGVIEPEGVASATARVFDASGPVPGDTSPSPSTAELIARHLTGRSLVVVLDNCEHVVAKAATLAHTLLGAVPGLRVIATSREPLGVPGEHLITVAGLATAVAVELFVDRGRAVLPGFQPDEVAEDAIEIICRRLDGLPLAIELAAARLRTLPLSTLADRLDDRFALLTHGARTARPRQRTLRAVVDWSYDLLFDDERRLFRRLSTFVGAFDLDAVEAICIDDEMPSAEILDVLSALVDKSLVTAPTTGDARYSQLQTLWQYARNRLDESDEADTVRARHAAFYGHLAEHANERLRGPTAPAWRDRLTSDLANLKAALDWNLAAEDTNAALSMASTTAWLWFLNGDFAEGARWLASALAAEGACRPELKATAHTWHAYFLGMSSSPPVGGAELEAALAVLRSGVDDMRLAEALLLQATVLVRAHEFSRSLEALREAHALLRPDQHGWLLGAHDMLLTWNLAAFGRLDEAESAARSSIERLDAVGEVFLVANALNALAGITAANGDLEGASDTYEALLQRCRASTRHPYLNTALIALAALRSRQGNDHAADDLYAEAIRCSLNPWLSADAMVGQAAVARRLGDLARARALLDSASKRYREADAPAGHARVLAGLAWWALGAGQANTASRFAADAVAAAQTVGDPETQLLADCAFAAAEAIDHPNPQNADSFVELARQRTAGPAHRSLTDEPDLVALAARLQEST
jgi:predicted ATPase/DNA-binding SARP family transcriptional activator